MLKKARRLLRRMAGPALAPGDFPLAERWAHTTLSLPMYPELTDAQVHEVCTVVRDFARSDRR